VSNQVLLNLVQVLLELDTDNSTLAPSPRYNDEPPLFGFSSYIGGRVPTWCGATGSDEMSTQIRALGESIERYCIANWDESLDVLSTAKAMKNCVPLSRFVDQQIVDPSFDRPLCTANDVIGWYPAVDRGGEPIFIPCQVAHYGGSEEPYIWDSNTNGLACHGSIEQARFGGLCELIERDAFLIRYHARVPAPRVRLPSNGEIGDLVAMFDRYRIDVEVYDIDIGFGLPVYMALLLDRTGHAPNMALGFGTDVQGVEAIRKSMFEAHQVRTYSRSLDSDSNPPSLDPIDSRAMLYHNATRRSIAHMLDESDDFVPVRDLDVSPADFIRRFPLDVYFVNLTLPGMAGFKVIKTIAPDLLNLYFDDRTSPLRNHRLLEHAGGEGLHMISHPFA